MLRTCENSRLAMSTKNAAVAPRLSHGHQAFFAGAGVVAVFDLPPRALPGGRGAWGVGKVRLSAITHSNGVGLARRRFAVCRRVCLGGRDARRVRRQPA